MKNKIIEEDLELLNTLGLEEDKIFLTDEDIRLVIKCFDKNYYSSTYKIKNTLRCPFAGINDFGSGQFHDYLSIFSVKTFDETAKLIAMLHGTCSMVANLDWLVSDVDNPSISECVCFRDELSRLDEYNKNHKGFMSEIKYLPLRDWIERHTRIIFGIAVVFLKEPVKYYKALYSLNKDAFDLTLKKNNDHKFIMENRDIKIDIAYESFLDLEGRGYDPEEVFKNE